MVAFEAFPMFCLSFDGIYPNNNPSLKLLESAIHIMSSRLVVLTQ